VLTTLTSADGTLLSDGFALMVKPQVRVVMYEKGAFDGYSEN
jgi:hypothetical protein